MRFSVFRLVLVIAVALFLLFYSADAWEKSQSELSVEVHRTYDPDRTGTVSHIEVAVKNHGDRTVSPVFMVLASKSNNHIWNSSIEKLEPGERRKLNLTPRRDFQKFPVSRSFKVRVNSAEDHLYKGLSELHVPELCVPPLKDPDFESGPYLDFGDPWYPLSHQVNTTYREGALVLNISATSRTSTSLLTRQTLNHIPKKLGVRFSEFTEDTVLDSETGDIIRGGGLVLSTGNHKRIWMVYSSDYGRMTVLEPAGDRLVIVTPFLDSSFDLQEVVEERGWDPGIPPHILYVGTVSGPENSYRMGLEKVDVPGCEHTASPDL